jgi:hypothetical protein
MAVGIIVIGASLSIIIIGKIPLLSQSASGWYYLFFAAGCISFMVVRSGKLDALWEKRVFRNLAIVASISLMILVVAALQKYTVSARVVAVIFTFCIVILLIAIAQYFPQMLSNKVKKLGENTLPVYAIHWCLLYSPLWKLEFYTKFLGKYPLFFRSACTTVAWIGICVLLIKLFRTNKVTRKLLLGEK